MRFLLQFSLAVNIFDYVFANGAYVFTLKWYIHRNPCDARRRWWPTYSVLGKVKLCKHFTEIVVAYMSSLSRSCCPEEIYLWKAWTFKVKCIMYTHKYSDITLRYPFKGRNFESQCQITMVMKQMVGHIATTTIIGLFTHMCTYVQDTAFVWPPFVSTVSRNWRCVWTWYMCVFYFLSGVDMIVWKGHD